MAIVHVFRKRVSAEAVSLKERFCRPGAAFGPAAYVEERMGVECVYHEQTHRLVCGKTIRSTCRLVEV